MSDPAFFASETPKEQPAFDIRPNRSHKLFRLGVLLFSLFIIGSIAFRFISQKTSPNSQTGETPTPTQIVAQQKPDKATYWTLYTTDLATFSFPEKYQAATLKDNSIGLFDDQTVYKNCQTHIQQGSKDANDPCAQFTFAVTGIKKVSASEYQAYIKGMRNPGNYKDPFGRDWKTEQKETTPYIFNAAIETNTNFYLISFEATKENFAPEGTKQFFEQMLSTFKFLPVKPTEIPATPTGKSPVKPTAKPTVSSNP